MDPDERALDATDVQAGGDNLLNPVTIATSLHPEVTNQSSSTMSRLDTPETANIITTDGESPNETDHEGAVLDESSLEAAPADETKDNNVILGAENLGSRKIETDETASDMAPVVNGDSQEMDSASDRGFADEGRRLDGEEQGNLPDDPVALKRHQRASLYRQGLKHQQDTEEALHCFLAAITGLTESEAFTELPQCLHQISNIYFEKKEYEKAVHFIQAEKMYYETALIDIVNLQKQFESNSEENGEDLTTGKGNLSSPASPDLPDITKAQEYENLAKLCLKESKPQLALEYCGKATKIYRKMYGDSHPVTVGSLDLFTLIYADVGKKLYADAMQKFDTEENVLQTSSGDDLQPKKSDQETTPGEETTNELRQRSKDDSVIQSQTEIDSQNRTEFEPAPQQEEQDDWVTTCLLMLLFLLITVLVLLIMSYFYCLGNERSSICHQFKGDLSYWYMKIKHYYLGFGRR